MAVAWGVLHLTLLHIPHPLWCGWCPCSSVLLLGSANGEPSRRKGRNKVWTPLSLLLSCIPGAGGQLQ